MQFTVATVAALTGLAFASPLTTPSTPTSSAPPQTTTVGPPIARTQNFTIQVNSVQKPELDGASVVVPRDGSSVSLELQAHGATGPYSAAVGYLVGTPNELDSHAAKYSVYNSASKIQYEAVVKDTEPRYLSAQRSDPNAGGSGAFGINKDTRELEHIQQLWGIGDSFLACGDGTSGPYTVTFGKETTDCAAIKLVATYQS